MQSGLSSVQKLNNFVSDVVLPNVEAEKIFIFIDEIDSILSLDFSVDDFFALIRHFYNVRTEKSDFERLGFALFGVATPGDLIGDRKRTPFNIGTAIELSGLDFPEVMCLTGGLSEIVKQPEAIVSGIINWTGGQPFLTQKICALVRNYAADNSHATKIFPGGETAWLEQFIKTQIIDRWESQDEPEHLKTIRDRILKNKHSAGRLLGLYQKILQQEKIVSDDSVEQSRLLLSGLVTKSDNQLVVRNRVYAEIFDSDWVKTELAALRPYDKALNSWVESGYQDKSRLLRGQALKEAQTWAKDKSLSDDNYRFLAASQELEQEIARNQLESARLQEVEIRLKEKHRNERLQKRLIGVLAIGLAVSSTMGLIAYRQSRKAIAFSRELALNEIKAHATSARALFASHQTLDALLEAIQANQKIKQIPAPDIPTLEEVNVALLQTVQGAVEYNRLSGHQGEVLQVAYSPDGQTIATASADNTIKLWNKRGRELATLEGHTTIVRSVTFSPDGQTIASASADNTIKLWNLQGEPISTIKGHTAAIRKVAFSPDGKLIASGSADKTVKIWNLQGREVQSLLGHIAIRDLAFSPDGQTIATVSTDRTIKLWSDRAQQSITLIGHNGTVLDVEFSPDGQTIATSSADNTIKLWNLQGKELRTLEGHSAAVRSVHFSPDGQTIASASADKTIKLWNLQGAELATLRNHQAGLWQAIFSPDGSILASASEDKTIKLWDLASNNIIQNIEGHDSAVLGLSFSPDGKSIASGSRDNTVKVWNLAGNEIATFTGHTTLVESVKFSPDGEIIASASGDRTIKLWNLQGEELGTFKRHSAAVRNIEFSPDGKYIGSASEDTTAILWDVPKLLNLKPLPYACNWVEDYLKTNTEVEDRDLCN